MSKPRLSYDKTGINPQNRIPNELHDVALGGPRIIILNEGSYYLDSVEIRAGSTSAPLIKGTDWEMTRLDLDVSADTGKEVGFGISITNPTYQGDTLVTYQAVGGYEGKGLGFYEELAKLITAIGTGPISWERINHPSTFTPEEHTHSVKQLTELEAVSNALDGLRDAFQKSHSLGITGNALEGKSNRILALIASLRSDINKIASGVVASVSDEDIGKIDTDLVNLAALNADMMLRMLYFEQEQAEIKDILSRLMTQLSEMFQNTSDTISVN